MPAAKATVIRKQRIAHHNLDDFIVSSYAFFAINVSSTDKSIPNLWGMPGCNNKAKVPVPKPIKANLKPKPKMEVPGNKQLAGANPIFLLRTPGSLPRQPRLAP